MNPSSNRAGVGDGSSPASAPRRLLVATHHPHEPASGEASTTPGSSSTRACNSRGALTFGGLDCEGAAFRQLADVRWRPFGQHLALVQHHDVVAARGLVQIGGAEQHRHALVAHQAADDVPQFAPGERIDADGGLVQQKQIGRAHQGAGEPQLLFHAA